MIYGNFVCGIFFAKHTQREWKINDRRTQNWLKKSVNRKQERTQTRCKNPMQKRQKWDTKYKNILEKGWSGPKIGHKNKAIWMLKKHQMQKILQEWVQRKDLNGWSCVRYSSFLKRRYK